MLKEITIPEFKNAAGKIQQIRLSYQVFGPEPGEAPVVLVNHALTGNSKVTGANGWWKDIVGPGEVIDTEHFSVICFNIPGNGFDGKDENLIKNYQEFTLRNIARIFLLGLEKLNVKSLFAAIGGSVGGALAWEMAALEPDFIQNLIPIAADLKATDWVLAQCKVQDQILKNSSNPVHDARLHAMTFYRTPQSFSAKFGRRKNAGLEYEVHSWLAHHGKTLEKRYRLASYKLMNHLLTTIDIGRGSSNYLEEARKIKSNIHLVAVDSDYFFLAEENLKTFRELSPFKENIFYHEIHSIHGHDAFLIEYEQLKKILEPIFNLKTIKDEKNKYRSVRHR